MVSVLRRDYVAHERKCLVFRFEHGKIEEVTNFCSDQHKADLFFHEHYRLKPIPERLAE
ncbi:hypothetical protein Jab_2c10930 [Janthinobacterium sp. HH01]|uniref:hypothetical protein n=1 Tax=Janthinobacterium sp. HH01 TaxID=1198452 RepID=UPI0002AEAA83|nr:hypothetical protein [Janthinobacterium sp. HH01]ELX09033.1 hypothetical protein Jab_2c10930 [Janthinobacterium sp. HH01]